MTDEQLRALLRLKRFEQPPEGYFEGLLRDVHRRQREELLRRPLWNIAIERMQTFFGEHSMSSSAYAGAMAAVMVAGLMTISFLSPRTQSHGVVAANSPQMAPAAPTPAAEPPITLHLEQGPDTLITQINKVTAPTNVFRSPRYIIDARPVSWRRIADFVVQPSAARRGDHLRCGRGHWPSRRPASGSAGVHGRRFSGDGLAGRQQQQLKMPRCGRADYKPDEHGLLAGSGFFVDPKRAFTPRTALRGIARHVVLRGDQEVPGPPSCCCRPQIRKSALVKVDIQTPFPSHRQIARPGGRSARDYSKHPMDPPLTPSFGLVGGFDRNIPGRYFATTHLRANVPVQRGEGGAPLLNMNGEVVGILISSLDQGSASFALPIEAAEKVRRDFIRYGCVRPAWLGLQMEVAQPIHGSTAQVQNLLTDGAAEKAGIKVGDVFLRIAQSKITCPEDMVDATFFLTAQDTVPVVVARGEADPRPCRCACPTRPSTN